jgi:hypothetical protein
MVYKVGNLVKNEGLYTRSEYGHSVNRYIKEQHPMKCEWGVDAN